MQSAESRPQGQPREIAWHTTETGQQAEPGRTGEYGEQHGASRDVRATELDVEQERACEAGKHDTGARK
jgi:hypothetical protein